ncbi:MAG: hypothetical protein JKY52_17580 [Flavobacteriales bacterium]|nr:hypothetical protein [Flavobacteriales bacterium]
MKMLLKVLALLLLSIQAQGQITFKPDSNFHSPFDSTAASWGIVSGLESGYQFELRLWISGALSHKKALIRIKKDHQGRWEAEGYNLGNKSKYKAGSAFTKHWGETWNKLVNDSILVLSGKHLTIYETMIDGEKGASAILDGTTYYFELYNTHGVRRYAYHCPEFRRQYEKANVELARAVRILDIIFREFRLRWEIC